MGRLYECGLFVVYGNVGDIVLSVKNGLEVGDFYGMELPWVGAFTDFRGSGYRNPVQNLG